MSTSLAPEFIVVWNWPITLSTSDPVSVWRTTTDNVAVEGTLFMIHVSSHTGDRVLDLTDDLQVRGRYSHS
jgi:hypothetical protein